ncbi:MAG: hypothetical protein V1912_04050 [bacterium]
MTAETHDLSRLELAGLMAGDPRLRARLAAGECFRAETPFRYPGRRGPVVVYLTPGPGAAPSSASASGVAPSSASASGVAPTPRAPAARPVRISEGGDVIKSLDEQGMDLSIDMILSKTVFNAVKQVEGGALAGGQVYLDSTSDNVAADLWRFLQLVAEIIGLRHSKYKDALLRLSRREDAPDLIGWETQ